MFISFSVVLKEYPSSYKHSGMTLAFKIYYLFKSTAFTDRYTRSLSAVSITLKLIATIQLTLCNDAVANVKQDVIHAQ
jgi:hypothetical protein